MLGNVMAAESAKIFKRVMWCNRRPRLLRVLAEELVEFGRCVVTGEGQPRDRSTVDEACHFSQVSLLVSGGTAVIRPRQHRWVLQRPLSRTDVN